jgi:hypothetical protein
MFPNLPQFTIAKRARLRKREVLAIAQSMLRGSAINKLPEGEIDRSRRATPNPRLKSLSNFALFC